MKQLRYNSTTCYSYRVYSLSPKRNAERDRPSIRIPRYAVSSRHDNANYTAHPARETPNLPPAHSSSIHQADDPVNPPVAPVFPILLSASAVVSHVILVPGLLTSGSARQVVPALQGVSSKEPPTHWAKEPLMHACCPSTKRRK